MSSVIEPISVGSPMCISISHEGIMSDLGMDLSIFFCGFDVHAFQ